MQPIADVEAVELPVGLEVFPVRREGRAATVVFKAAAADPLNRDGLIKLGQRLVEQATNMRAAYTSHNGALAHGADGSHEAVYERHEPAAYWTRSYVFRLL